jgi:hypothetical protein
VDLTSGIPAQLVVSGFLILPSGYTVLHAHETLWDPWSMTLFSATIAGSFVAKPFPHASFSRSSGFIRPGRQSLGALPPEFTGSSILTRFAAAPCHTTPKSAMNADLQFTRNTNFVDPPAPNKSIYYSSPYPILNSTSCWT